MLRNGTILHNGKYVICKVLGQGGFGITYLAEHAILGTQVAIKEFFPKSFCDRDINTNHVTIGTSGNRELVARYKAKFLKEALSIAKLDDRHIVKIHDVFEENNTAYYVMDYIDGKSLSDIVKANGPLSEEQAVCYILEVAFALTYLHRLHINHLDVKPANIMIRNKDNAIILIDFGVSKQYDSDGNQTSTTPVGISHGYAPIEQYRDGGVKSFSPQTDLYSLAATLYYLLTGTVPPQAPNLLDEELVFPANISKYLVAAISQAMSSKRSDRQKSISEFYGQLILEGDTLEENTVDTQIKDLETDNTSSDKESQSDRQWYETDKSYQHRKQLQSMSKDELKTLQKKNLKKGIICVVILVLLAGFYMLCGLFKEATSSEPSQELVDSVEVVEVEPLDMSQVEPVGNDKSTRDNVVKQQIRKKVPVVSYGDSVSADEYVPDPEEEVVK